MSQFILREVSDWSAMVKTASLKLAAPAVAPMPAMAGEAPEGMPTAPARKMAPDEEKPVVAPEAGEYLQKEHKELENARAIVMQMWGLLSGEAGEGGYDEVDALMKAIKAMEDFITVEETGVKPGKGKKSASLFVRYAGKLKDYLMPIYDELHAQQESLMGRDLSHQEEMALWQEAMEIGAKRMKEYAKENPATPEPVMPAPENDPAWEDEMGGGR